MLGAGSTGIRRKKSQFSSRCSPGAFRSLPPYGQKRITSGILNCNSGFVPEESMNRNLTSYQPDSRGPLDGIRVLDLSRLVAGNMARSEERRVGKECRS